MTEKIQFIPARLKNAAVGGHVAGSEDIIDENMNMTQNDVNATFQTAINALDGQNYVTVETYASLPATGAVNTIYRVSNYDGAQSQVDATKYSEYAWNGSTYVLLDVKSQIGEVYDISAAHSGQAYAGLAAALDGGNNVPEGIRKGGMSIKFVQTSVQTSDNKYMQYRLMSDEWSTTVTDWQGVDEEPTAGSHNLVESGGVAAKLYIYPQNNGYIDENGIIQSTPAWRYSDMFPVIPSSTVTVYNRTQSGIVIIAFYGANKEFLKDVSPVSQSSTWDTNNITVPQGAYFARVHSAYNAFYKPYCYTDKSFLESSARVYDALKEAGETISGDGSLFVNNGYIGTNGTIKDGASSWKYTDLIIIPTGATFNAVLYGAPNDVANMVFYDNEENIVQNGLIIAQESGITTLTGTVPENALYVRMCSYTNSGNLSKVSFAFKYEPENLLNTIITANQKSDVVEPEALIYHNNFMGKPFSFNGKTAAFFGDSVTNGVKSDPLSAATKPYRQWLCERLGLTGTNYAISATFICDPTNDPESILNQVLTNITSQSDFDFIFIAGGINDFWTGKPLGTISDNTYATFYGALNVMCDHLKTVLNGKTTEVIFLTPINCTRSDLSQATNSLDAYRNAIFRVAAMNGFNVVDTSAIGFPDDINDSAYRAAVIADGVHPTEYGHKMMGLNLAAILS